jgi:hypothetical protein
MTKERLEVRIEIEPMVPETVGSVQALLESVFEEMNAWDELTALRPADGPRLVFAQASPDQVLTLAIAVLSLLCEVPQAWPHVRPFLERLWLRLRGVTSGDITLELAVGGRRVRAEGLHAGDGFELRLDDCIVQLTPREEDD